MQDIVIVSAARTAVGKFGGALAKTPATELGAIVIREAIARAGLSADQIGEVIMGQVLTAGVGQNPARQASIKAGVAKETPALTINAVCGSGLKAVISSPSSRMSRSCSLSAASFFLAASSRCEARLSASSSRASRR